MSLSVEHCCFLLVVDCMCIYNTFKKKLFLSIFVQVVPRYFLILYSAVSSFWGIALYKSDDDDDDDHDDNGGRGGGGCGDDGGDDDDERELIFGYSTT